jgi:hypothetical protein
MKALIVIAILALAGYLAYTYLYIPLSDEESLVRSMEKRFDEASRAFLNAERRMGATGLDTTDDVEQAMRKIRRLETEVKNLKPTFKEEKSKQRADELEKKIKEFKRRAGML